VDTLAVTLAAGSLAAATQVAGSPAAAMVAVAVTGKFESI
jgi:hypothetical protein